MLHFQRRIKEVLWFFTSHYKVQVRQSSHILIFKIWLLYHYVFNEIVCTFIISLGKRKAGKGIKLLIILSYRISYTVYCSAERLHVIIIGQRHAKRDLWTFAKSVDSDQPLRLRRSVWSGSALFDTRHINGTYISCCVNNWITDKCFQYCIGADLGLHYA